MQRTLLIALDSVGIDPLGHQRADSVYARSRFLFPADQTGDMLALTAGPIPRRDCIPKLWRGQSAPGKPQLCREGAALSTG